ncbi:MAG: hypothetical protein QME60_09480, partial [Verrucomicrobiota bacterium]|nr:hypothetical protein [Verrucomicrobiota bacterium]
MEFAQVSEQRGHVLGGVFVDPAQADEGIEDEERGFDVGHSLRQPISILGDIEQEAPGRDDHTPLHLAV